MASRKPTTWKKTEVIAAMIAAVAAVAAALITSAPDFLSHPAVTATPTLPSVPKAPPAPSPAAEGPRLADEAEFIAILDFRAQEIAADLRAEGNPETAATILALHRRNVEAIKTGSLMLSHELSGEINSRVARQGTATGGFRGSINYDKRKYNKVGPTLRLAMKKSRATSCKPQRRT